MKIFIDFDDVIFHAKKFKKDLIGIFKKHGITRQEFNNSYYAFSKGSELEGKYYDPKKQIKILKKRFQVDNKKLQKDLDKFLKDLSGYIFPDVHYFLNNFSKSDLFLISYGHARFQRKKIRSSGMSKCFRKVLISKNNKMNIILNTCRKYGISPSKEDVILIDDRPEQLERTEQGKRRIKTFRICRPEGRYSDLLCVEMDYEVRNLREVFKIIKKEKMK